MQTLLSRRTLLQRGAVLGAAAAAGTLLASCSSSRTESADQTPQPRQDPTTPSSSERTLLAYFSRSGENDYYGGRRNLRVGNTEVLAGVIGDLTECDGYRIEASDPYPAGYDATVDRNVREQDADARPGIANPLDSIDQYDAVLLGSPIWNVRPPMIMTTFLEGHDFTGKQVYPLVTYAVSGLGRTEAVYTNALPGIRLGQGLAVQGEEAGDHRADVEAWLRSAGLLR